MNESTVIPPGISEACLLLLAIDDEIIEDNERFTVIVEAKNPSDMVNGTTMIIISDNDGNHYEITTIIINFATSLIIMIIRLHVE